MRTPIRMLTAIVAFALVGRICLINGAFGLDQAWKAARAFWMAQRFASIDSDTRVWSVSQAPQPAFAPAEAEPSRSERTVERHEPIAPVLEESEPTAAPEPIGPLLGNDTAVDFTRSTLALGDGKTLIVFSPAATTPSAQTDTDKSTFNEAQPVLMPAPGLPIPTAEESVARAVNGIDACERFLTLITGKDTVIRRKGGHNNAL